MPRWEITWDGSLDFASQASHSGSSLRTDLRLAGKTFLMNRRIFVSLIALFVVTCHAAIAAAQDWQPLFNGKDLSDWKPVGEGDNWIAKDGELRCTGKPGAHRIRTEKEYANFELRLEFKIEENGNSGVFLRAPEAGAPWVEGLEVQLLDDYGPKWKNLSPEQFTASIYAVAAPSKRATKPAGQWRAMRISCVDRQIKVWVNEQQVVDVDLDTQLDKAKKVPGIKRKSGYIGFSRSRRSHCLS